MQVYSCMIGVMITFMGTDFVIHKSETIITNLPVFIR